MTSIKKRRVKIAGRYFASGYGRGVNKRNVYEIDGRFYAYHPAYAKQTYQAPDGELSGYIEVKRIGQKEDYSYHA